MESEIGPTLRKVRLDRKWTQAALALRLAISLDCLQKIELGRNTPNPELNKKDTRVARRSECAVGLTLLDPYSRAILDWILTAISVIPYSAQWQ